MDSGPSALHGSSTFQRFSQHEKFCINPLTKAFFQHLHRMYFFRLKKTRMSEGVKILARRLYELYREQKRRLLYFWCNSVYLLYTKSCFSKQKKKEKYNLTNCFHCAQYPHPPSKHKSLFSHGFTKQSTLQQCWLTLFLLPSR